MPARSLCLLSLLWLLPSESEAVVGGEAAAEGRWPDVAGIASAEGGAPWCTGTLIAPDVVLTSASCLAGAPPGMPWVVVNTVEPGSSGTWIAATATHYEQDWYLTYDVGLLILSEDAPIPPRALALDCVVDEILMDGADVAIVGYGATNTGGTQNPDVLQAATSKVTDHDCSEIASGCTAAVSPGGELVAGGGGVDSCYGDGGGPLYLLTDTADYLVGVTSRAVNTASNPCGDGSIYARPDAVVDWIESTAGITLAKPSCDEPGDTDDSGDTDDLADTDDPADTDGACGCQVPLRPVSVLGLLVGFPILTRRRKHHVR